MQRIDELGLKYILILPILWISDGIPFDYSIKQLMLFRKRMKFILNKDGTEIGPYQPRTNCVVASNGILKEDLIIIR